MKYADSKLLNDWFSFATSYAERTFFSVITFSRDRVLRHTFSTVSLSASASIFKAAL
jgi:hypothetical protein